MKNRTKGWSGADIQSLFKKGLNRPGGPQLCGRSGREDLPRTGGAAHKVVVNMAFKLS